MKLTKEQLQRIIKEELISIEEQEERSPGNIKAMQTKAINIIMNMHPEDLAKLLMQLDPQET